MSEVYDRPKSKKSSKDFQLQPHQQPRLKCRTFVKVMAIAELIAALYLILSEIICLSLTLKRNVSWYFTQVCVFGTGFWVGLIIFTDALIGVRLARPTGYSHCRITAHLVLSILAAIASGVQLIFAAMQTSWLIRDERSTPGYYLGERDDLGLIRGNLAVNILVCVMAGISIVFCIISGSLMCRNKESCADCCSDETEEQIDVVFSTVSTQERRPPQVELIARGVPVPPRYIQQPQEHRQHRHHRQTLNRPD